MLLGETQDSGPFYGGTVDPWIPSSIS